MIKSYLTIAFRSLWKNKSFTAINILGLALGMACSLLIMLWVQDERSIDGFHANKQQLYTIYERQYYDGKVESGYSTPGLLAEEMKKVIPEVKYAAGFAWTNNQTFSVGDKINKQEGNAAGADFFKMFSYKLLEGTPESALKDINSLAISRKMAEIFFGSPQAAMGKIMRFENRKDLMVTAVFENLPANASQKFDCLRHWDAFLEDNQWAKDWGNNGPRTLIMLQPNTNATNVEAKIKHFLDTYNKDQDKTFRIELAMQPFSDVYLKSNFKNGQIDGGRIEYVRLFSIVAIFILLIACINFMNLATARSAKRAKEVGIRKVVGAVRSVLIGQFVGEALLLTFFSIVISIVLVVLLLPSFNNLTGKQMALPISELSFWLSLVGLTVLTGLVAGSYPAFFLSSLNPIRVLKGTLKFDSKAMWLRQGLVVFQFALSIILIIGMIVIYRQVDFIQTKNLGYDRENLIYLPLEGDLPKSFKLLKEKISQLPDVKWVSRISQTPTNIQNSTGGVNWTGKDPAVNIQFTQIAVGYNFVKTMNLQLKEGRDFSKDFSTDTTNYLINEAALKRIGYKNPIGEPFTLWRHPGKIIGVLKDFHFTSLHEPINPLIVRLKEEENDGNALIRIEAGKTPMILPQLEKICKELNPKFPFTFYFSDQEYTKLYKSEQVVSKLSNFFAFLAIFISCLGLLGLAAFTAEQRTKEIGIRKVLGASVTSIIGLLSAEFIKMVLIAALIAFPLSWWAMNGWLEKFAYRIDIQWWYFLVAGLSAGIIALLTVSYQAIRAALMNPVKSLKSE